MCSVYLQNIFCIYIYIYIYIYVKFVILYLQCVVDDKMLITNAYTGWPGCTHDARVLRYSCLYHRAEELFLENHHILGDSAYPLRNWLLTPFKKHPNNFGLTKVFHL